MGHAIDYLHFEEKMSKKAIEEACNERSERYSDYHGVLYHNIRWLDKICEDLQAAEDYIEENDRYNYDQLAVRYRVYPKLESSKTLLSLIERRKKEHTKLEEYIKNHSIKTFKSDYIGCPKCGSKLKISLLRSECCALCYTDLRGKTTLDTIARYQKNIKELNEKIKAEERNIQQKNLKKSTLKWLVKIEYHV